MADIKDTIKDLYCKWCPDEDEECATFTLEEKRGCVACGGFADDIIPLIESEFKSRLASMVDEEGLMTEDSVWSLRITEDKLSGSSMSRNTVKSLVLLGAKHQRVLDKLHEEQAVKAERERIISALMIEIKKHYDEAVTNPFPSDRLNKDHTLIHNSQAAAYKELVEWLSLREEAVLIDDPEKKEPERPMYFPPSEPQYTVVIRNNETSEERECVVKSVWNVIQEYLWFDGNNACNACDCVLSKLFAIAKGEPDPDCPCGNTKYKVLRVIVDGKVVKNADN